VGKEGGALGGQATGPGWGSSADGRRSGGEGLGCGLLGEGTRLAGRHQGSVGALGGQVRGPGWTHPQLMVVGGWVQGCDSPRGWCPFAQRAAWHA